MSDTTTGGGAGTANPRHPLSYLHILTFFALAVAQPLLDLLAEHAEFFVIRRLDSWEIGALLAVLLFLVPLPAILMVAAASAIGSGARRVALALSIAAPCALIALSAMKKLALDLGTLSFVVAVVAGLACAGVYFRFSAARLFVTFLGTAMIVVPAAFLLNPKVGRIVLQRSVGWTGLDASKARAPVFFLILDELSQIALLDGQGRVNRHRFPNLAALAARGTWFENATTVSDGTNFAVPAILSGRFPEHGKLPGLQDYPQNLFTMLGGAYSIWAREPITVLCPAQLNRLSGFEDRALPKWLSLMSDLELVYRHLVLPSRYADALPAVTQNWRNFRRPDAPSPDGDSAAPEDDWVERAFAEARSDRAAEFRRFLEVIRPDADRSLYLYHLLLPHVPLEYAPSGRKYPNDLPGLVKKRWTHDDWLVAQAYQRYLLQTQFLDGLIGELVARLEELGLFDRSLIVLVADHGVSFRPGGFKRLTEANAHEVVPVPLLIKKPHQQAGEVLADRVSVLDVVPTVLDLLGVEIPDGLEGGSAFGPSGGGATGKVLYVSQDRILRFDDELYRRRDDSVAERLERFGDGSDPLDLFRAAPHSEILGRDLADFTVVDDPALRVNLDAGPMLEDWDPASSFSPMRITGQVSIAARGAETTDLAVAVNGTVWATTRTHGGGARWKIFSALAPESAWQAGRNQIEVLAVEKRSSGLSLRRARSGPAPELELLQDSSGNTLGLMIDGRRMPVTRGHYRGWLNSFVRRGESIVIIGWAAERVTGMAADEIFLFHEGRLLARVAPVIERPDVVKATRDGAVLRSGFRFEVPANALARAAQEGIRVIAVSANRRHAAELDAWYKLGGSGAVIEGADGRMIEIRPGLAGGTVTVTRRQETRWYLEARAAVPAGRSLRRLLVFRDARFHTVHVLEPTAPAGATAARDVEFDFSIHVFGLERRDPLRFLAELDDGTAIELRSLESPVMELR